MAIWAIIPIKRLNKAKTSFNKTFNVKNRQRLVIAMLEDMLNAIRKAPSITRTAVVCQEKKVLDFAELNGALGVIESGLGLNEALKLAIKHVVALGANSVLLLPGDLPLLKYSDVENLTAMATAKLDVVIGPSKANGTNALLLRPPNVMDLKFGGESYPLHVAESIRVGIKPHIYRSETVAFDIDEPEDLLKIETIGLGTKTHEFFLSQIKSRPYLKRK